MGLSRHGVRRSHPGTLVFAVLLLAYAYFLPRWADWNQNSRLDLVLAAVDKGTLAIDDYYQNTGDYAYYHGHYYTDKAPGTSFLGIPVYAALKPVLEQPFTRELVDRLAARPALVNTLNATGTGLSVDKLQVFIALTVVTFFVVAIPSALLGVLFVWLLGQLAMSPVRRIALALAFGLATPAYAYANNYYGHQIAAFILFAAFCLLFRLRDSPHPVATWRLLPAGLCLGYALLTEYPTALIVAGLGVYAALQVQNWRKLGWLALGALPPLVLGAAYHLAIFGTPLPVGYKYSVLWQDTHRIGLLSLTVPNAEALWGITFGAYRGLFWISPFLLLAAPGLYFFWQQRQYRSEFWLAVWAVVSFFLFNASSAMWSGGFAIGPRYLIPALPFLVLPIGFLLSTIRRRWLDVFVGLLAFVSMILVWAQTVGGQSFPQDQPNPLLEYSLSHLLGNDIARNAGMLVGLSGWRSVIPLVLVMAAFLLTVGTLHYWFRPRDESGRSDSLSASIHSKELLAD